MGPLRRVVSIRGILTARGSQPVVNGFKPQKRPMWRRSGVTGRCDGNMKVGTAAEEARQGTAVSLGILRCRERLGAPCSKALRCLAWWCEVFHGGWGWESGESGVLACQIRDKGGIDMAHDSFKGLARMGTSAAVFIVPHLSKKQMTRTELEKPGLHLICGQTKHSCGEFSCMATHGVQSLDTSLPRLPLRREVPALPPPVNARSFVQVQLLRPGDIPASESGAR